MSPASFVPVILAGGNGERFWPLSHNHRSKQFLTLDETGRSLLQVTSDRLAEISGHTDDVVVVTGEKYRTQNIKKVVQQLKAYPELERFA